MSANMQVTLTADGQSSPITIKPVRTGAQPMQNIAVFGTFGGGTVTLQVSYNGGTTYFSVTDSAGPVTFTANGARVTYLLPSPVNTSATQTLVRMSLSGATNPSLTMTVRDGN